MLLLFDDMIADIMTNKKIEAIIKKLFIRCIKLNISVIFITQSYFRILKDGNTSNIPRRIPGGGNNLIDNSDYDQNKRGTKKTEIAVPLKYLSNFWRKLDMPLINCD